MLVESETMTDFCEEDAAKPVENETASHPLRYSIEFESADASVLQMQKKILSSTAPSAKQALRQRKQLPKAKDKPFINFIPLPYCAEQPPATNGNTAKLQLPRLQNHKRPKVVNQAQAIVIAVDEVPINEYLDYCLTQDINVEIRDAKVLAEEVKRIKEEKWKKMLGKPKRPQQQTKKSLKRRRMPLGVLKSNLTFS